MALYTLGPLLGKCLLWFAVISKPLLLVLASDIRPFHLGPAIGPVAGGFIAQDLSLAWVFIVIASVFSLVFSNLK